MNKMLVLVLVILFAIIGFVVFGVSKSETLIREAVLEYAPKATGASVTLDKVDVAFMGGSMGLFDLTIGNPQGFKSDYAFKVDNVAVQIDLDSILADVIRINEIRIDGADLIYEIGTKGNNISKIQRNIESYAKSLGLDTSGTRSGAKFIIDHIYINGTRVTLASDLVGGRGAGLTLPDIHLKNIGTEDRAATAGEVGAVIFGAVNKGLSKVITKHMLDNTLTDVKKKLDDILK